MASLVQTINPNTSTGTITATPAQTLQGSLLLVFIGTSALTDTVSTVTDNGNNTYTKAYGVASGSGGDTECWYSINSNPTTSVVVTFSAAVTTKSVFFREYSGMSKSTTCFDRNVSTSGSGTSVSTGASSTTQDATEIIVCSCSCLGTNPTLSAGSGYGNYTSQALLAGLSLHAIEDKTVSTIGTQTGTMTAGGTLPVWDVGLATFIISPGRGILFNGYVTVGGGQSRNDIAS